MRKEKFCDPSVCDNCLYIGEGDFICDKYSLPILVIDDWYPNENFLKCKKEAAGKQQHTKK